MGQPIEPPIKFEDGTQLNFKVIGQGNAPYFQDLLPIYTKQYKLDVLFVLLDSFMLYGSNNWFSKLDLSPAKTIFLFPSDGGGGMPLNCEEILKFVDCPVAMAKYGQKQVKKIHNINTKYIPHAVDTDKFYPLSKEEKNKLKEKWELEDKFVIGVVARNQGRKFLGRTIKIMSEYAKLNPNSILLLHCDPNDAAQVFPISSLIQRYGIENRVRFTGTRYFRGFTDKGMNEVYNLMDVFLHTSSGEGFGIGLIEAQAVGVPVIGTNYTTTYELCIEPKSGIGINLVGMTEEECNDPKVYGKEILEGTLTGSWSVERGICSIRDGVKKLDLLCKDKELREKLGKNGIENIRNNYSWKVIGPKWVKLFEEVGNEF